MTDLIKGLMVVIGISMALGRYGRLQEFARRQAVESLRGWHTQPYFPKNYTGFRSKLASPLEAP